LPRCPAKIKASWRRIRFGFDFHLAQCTDALLQSLQSFLLTGFEDWHGFSRKRESMLFYELLPAEISLME
jgi:hypothetical protein